MDIHAPHGGVHSLKDFVIHIAIVTLGIVIAFSFELARESAHERKLLRETRESFRTELAQQRKMMSEELPAVEAANTDLKALSLHMPEGTKDAPELARRLEAIHNPYYFFSFKAWQTAVASGGLAKMLPHEELQYSAAELGIRLYTEQQNETRLTQDRAVTFFEAHPNPSAGEMREGRERVLLFERAEDVLAHLARQTQRVIDASYEISEH